MNITNNLNKPIRLIEIDCKTAYNEQLAPMIRINVSMKFTDNRSFSLMTLCGSFQQVMIDVK